MFLETIRLAIRSMFANPSRTLLTMLGVTVGIAAVIALMAVGEGQKVAQLEMYELLGTNRITVRRGWSERRVGANYRVDLDLAREIMEKCPAAKAVSPVKDGRGRIEYLRNNLEQPVIGAIPEYFAVENYQIAQGREFNADEVRSGDRVAVLGFTTASDLFGPRNPVGEFVKINGKSFEVIGTLAEKGATPWRSLDEQTIVPLTAYQRVIDKGEELDDLTVQAHTTELAADLETQIEELLRERFPLYAQDDELFSIRNRAEQQAEREKAAQLIQGFLVVIGGIALFIGGIGIMNIMLVTVSERTGEIGLRKALGATPSLILSQFLTESLVLCLSSGLAGVAIGLFVINALTKYSESETAQLPAPVLNTDAIYISVAVSAAIAIIFGLLPAINASRLEPIKALRFE